MIMHIAYVVGIYPQPSETFIAREMEGLRARGHCIDVYSVFVPESGRAAEVTYGWTPASYLLLGKLFPHRARRALGARWGRLFRARGYDAVVAHFGSIPSTVALYAAGTEIPLFISLHARDIYASGEAMAAKLAQARRVLTCTRANQAYLLEHFPQAADRLTLLYHGLPAVWMDAPPTPRLRASSEPLRILAVGRFVPKKGFDILLAALGCLQQRGVPFSARIVGDGRRRTRLERQCRTLGLQHAVQWPGWQPEAALRDSYAWADIFCCPSVIAPDGDRDGLPNVLVEAMSTGLPAVGSELSGIPEAIEHEVSGLLVPPGRADLLADALARVADPALRARLGARADALVRERFRFQEGIALLERLLATGGRG